MEPKRDFLLSEIKRMQRLYSRNELPEALATYVEERYYPRIAGVTEKPLKDIALPTKVDIELIKVIVLEYYGLSWTAVWTRNRKKDIVTARNVLMYFFRTKGLLSFEKIGDIFLFDHSTIIHSKRRLLSRVEQDEDFRKEIEYLNQAIATAYNNQTTTP